MLQFRIDRIFYVVQFLQKSEISVDNEVKGQVKKVKVKSFASPSYKLALH